MKKEKNMLIAFLLNLAFAAFEVFGGIFTGSVAILSDAVHDLGDAVSIGASVALEKISKKSPDDKYTYGYARFSTLGGLFSVVVLLVGSAIAIYHAILRFIHPAPIRYNEMILFAVVGVAVNLLATLFTRGGKSVNQKAVNLHMLEDVLGWIVVLIGAIVMRFTGFALLDGILSIIVALYILIHALTHLKEIGDLFLLKTPAWLDAKAIKEELLTVDGVESIEHFHLWAVDEEKCVATLHVKTKTPDEGIKIAVRERLKERGIVHATIEVGEGETQPCPLSLCDHTHGHGCHHHGHHHGHAHHGHGG